MKSMLALMAGAMVFTACSSDDEFENINEQKASSLKPMTFTASMEGHGDATRTAIDGLNINWSTGDKIAIFDGVEDADHNFAHEFTLAGGAGSTSGTFTGSAAEGAEVYYALYPNVVSKIESKNVSQEEAEAAAGDAGRRFDRWKEEWEDYYSRYPEDLKREMERYGISEENQAIILAYLKGVPATIKSGVQQDGSKFSEVILPAKQTVAEGQYVDPKAMLMIAKSTDASTLQFKNVCAYVKVKPTFDCAGIALRSMDATKYLAGTVTVDYNGGAPTTTVTANGSNEVLLTGAIKADNTYYIAVRPETLSSGFIIEFVTADKSYYYARISSKNPDLARNNVTNLGEFATTGTWTVKSPTSGTDGAHAWILVSPTLRLATESAGKVAINAVDGIWGDKWVLLSAEEASLIGGNSSWTNNVATIGTAIFSDVLSCEISIGSYFWSSRTEDGYRYFYEFGNETAKGKTSGLTTTQHVLYKYIGE